MEVLWESKQEWAQRVIGAYKASLIRRAKRDHGVQSNFSCKTLCSNKIFHGSQIYKTNIEVDLDGGRQNLPILPPPYSLQKPLWQPFMSHLGLSRMCFFFNHLSNTCLWFWKSKHTKRLIIKGKSPLPILSYTFIPSGIFPLEEITFHSLGRIWFKFFWEFSVHC